MRSHDRGMDPLTPAQLATIAEFGPLYNARRVWAPKEKRLDELSIEIRSWYPDLAADQTAIAEGLDYDVQVGEKKVEKNWISIAAVSKAVGGWKGFQKICTVTFKALSNVIGNGPAEALQVESQTGHRKLVAVVRISPPVEIVELPKAA